MLERMLITVTMAMRVKLVNDEMEKQPFRESNVKLTLKKQSHKIFDLLQL
jgi:hypothetical protein